MILLYSPLSQVAGIPLGEVDPKVFIFLMMHYVDVSKSSNGRT
jgi:hypothetical protein